MYEIIICFRNSILWSLAMMCVALVCYLLNYVLFKRFSVVDSDINDLMSNLWLHPLFDIRDTQILQVHTVITCKSTHALQNKCSVLDHYFNCWRVIEVWKSLSESNSGDSRAILFVPEGGRMASCVWARWVFVAFPKVSFTAHENDEARTILRPV